MAAEAPVRVLSLCSAADGLFELRGLLEASGTGVPRRPPFDVTSVASVAEALALLAARSFEVAVVSGASSESELDATVGEIRERFPALPLVILLDHDDEQLALAAAARGVQDCVVRGELVGNLLARSLRYAMERQELQGQIERRSVMDELTGLYNRRGFFALGEQELKRARRRKEGFHLVFADVDGLKEVNDRRGHEAGDALIREAAALLLGIFRDTDILARLGGDEFAVIAHQTGDGAAGALRDRLDREIERRATDEPQRRVSLSVGIAAYEPASRPDESLDELLARADVLMYEEKRRRRRR